MVSSKLCRHSKKRQAKRAQLGSCNGTFINKMEKIQKYKTSSEQKWKSSETQKHKRKAIQLILLK